MSSNFSTVPLNQFGQWFQQNAFMKQTKLPYPKVLSPLSLDALGKLIPFITKFRLIASFHQFSTK